MENQVKENEGLTIQELVNAKNALQNSFEKSVSWELTLKIIEFIKYVEGKERYVEEVLLELFKKYGEKDEKGNYIPTADGKGYKLRDDGKLEYHKGKYEFENRKITDFVPTITIKEFSELKPKIGDAYYIMPILKNM